MAGQIFFLPQVKRRVIISNKLVYAKLPYKLRNDLKLKDNIRKLENVREISIIA